MFWSARGQFFALFFSTVLLSERLAAQNDTVKDDQASDFNLNLPERVEWFRNTGAGLFIHFGVMRNWVS